MSSTLKHLLFTFVGRLFPDDAQSVGQMGAAHGKNQADRIHTIRFALHSYC